MTENSAVKAGALVRCRDDDYLLLSSDPEAWWACRLTPDVWMASPTEAVLAPPDLPSYAWTWAALPDLRLRIPRTELDAEGLFQPWAAIDRAVLAPIKTWSKARGGPPPDGARIGPPLDAAEQPAHIRWRAEQAAAHGAWVAQLGLRAALRAEATRARRRSARTAVRDRIRADLRAGAEGLEAIFERVLGGAMPGVAWTPLAPHAAVGDVPRGIRFDEAGLILERHAQGWVLLVHDDEDGPQVLDAAALGGPSDEP
ncbi:MAG: hypothetical protein KC613_06735 [Myxococcales bacterium]|nr:hypothetical protein [Myxococcales bacterium]